MSVTGQTSSSGVTVGGHLGHESRLLVKLLTDCYQLFYKNTRPLILHWCYTFKLIETKVRFARLLKAFLGLGLRCAGAKPQKRAAPLVTARFDLIPRVYKDLIFVINLYANELSHTRQNQRHRQWGHATRIFQNGSTELFCLFSYHRRALTALKKPSTKPRAAWTLDTVSSSTTLT